MMQIKKINQKCGNILGNFKNKSLLLSSVMNILGRKFIRVPNVSLFSELSIDVYIAMDLAR